MTSYISESHRKPIAWPRLGLQAPAELLHVEHSSFSQGLSSSLKCGECLPRSVEALKNDTEPSRAFIHIIRQLVAQWCTHALSSMRKAVLMSLTLSLGEGHKDLAIVLARSQHWLGAVCQFPSGLAALEPFPISRPWIWLLQAT